MYRNWRRALPTPRMSSSSIAGKILVGVVVCFTVIPAMTSIPYSPSISVVQDRLLRLTPIQMKKLTVALDYIVDVSSAQAIPHHGLVRTYDRFTCGILDLL